MRLAGHVKCVRATRYIDCLLTDAWAPDQAGGVDFVRGACAASRDLTPLPFLLTSVVGWRRFCCHVVVELTEYFVPLLVDPASQLDSAFGVSGLAYSGRG